MFQPASPVRAAVEGNNVASPKPDPPSPAVRAINTWCSWIWLISKDRRDPAI